MSLSKNIGLILLIVVMGLGLFFALSAFLPSAEEGYIGSLKPFNKVTIGGVTFNISSKFELYNATETKDAFVNIYSHYYTYGNDGPSTRYITISVYKNKSVQQVVSNISTSDGIDAKAVTYGKHSGYWFNEDLFKSRSYYFIFEKDGKTVAIEYGSLKVEYAIGVL